MPKEMTAGELAERSLITKYRKTIWNRFIGGCKDYELIKPGDRIAVCISGGKDSMMLAKCMQHLQKYSDFPFEVEYLVMDPGYSLPNRALIEQNARTLELPIRIFESPIFGVVDEVEGGSPCYLCARMRRGYLYKEAQALGWPGGSLEPYAPGKCIGGSRFGNYEGLLPEKEGRTYTECDIDTLGAESRGAKRIVFSNDGLIYYTGDHYESFELLYGEE